MTRVPITIPRVGQLATRAKVNRKVNSGKSVDTTAANGDEIVIADGIVTEIATVVAESAIARSQSPKMMC
jgi:hypothetical protein